MKSFDRSIPCNGGEWTDNLWVIDKYPKEYVRARVVPWPEGAPDPSTVPQAGEQVIRTYDGAWARKVFTVVNGIPKHDKKHNVWRLWLTNPSYGSSHPALEEIEVYIEPTSPSRLKLYSANQIEEAFATPFVYYASASTLIERMNS